MGWMGLWRILGFALLIEFVWLLGTATRGRDRGETPDLIPRRQLANGDVDREAYERIMQQLGRWRRELHIPSMPHPD